jgi:hypothetical protein
MRRVRALPITATALVHHLAERFAKRQRETEAQHPLRVAVDAAAAARPAALADAVADALGELGVPPVRVRSGQFFRAASLRLERGREDPDAFYEDWLDTAALLREVLVPLGPEGSGRYLPSLWDVRRDRATRAAYATAPTGAVLLVDGTFLLGRTLPWDDTVHLALTTAGLRRRTPESEQWTLPAFERYEGEVAPLAAAGVVVRVDDPRHPALVEGRT